MQYLIIFVICLYYLLLIYSIFWWWHLPSYLWPFIIYSVGISLLNSKKAVRIQQFRDGVTIVLRQQYHTGLNKIKYWFPSICLGIITLTITFNFSVLDFLNFNLIPSVKVSGISSRLPESIKDKINTLGLYNMFEDWVRDEHLTS